LIHHTLLDHGFFALLLLIPIVEWKWTWPRHLAKLASGDRNARIDHYSKLIAGEWILTIGLLASWAVAGRTLADLRLAGDTPVHLGLGFAYVIALIALLVIQRRALLARPDRRARIRKAIEYGIPLLPHTARERRIFWIVSATAGFCEEVFFRGFLTWYLSAWMGLAAAVLLASLIFGAGHVYLGIAQVPKTAFIGVIFAVVVALTGSLWPAMLLHAAIDWNSGELGFKLIKGNTSRELPAA